MYWLDTDIAIGFVISIYLVAVVMLGIFGEATAEDILLISIATVITIVAIQIIVP